MQSLLRSVRIHPPPYQGRLPAISLVVVHSSRSHPRVAFKAQSVEPSPIHNTSCPFHVHPPFVHSSSFQEVVAYPHASHSRSTSPNQAPKKIHCRVTDPSSIKIFDPPIRPSAHPPIRHSSPPCFASCSNPRRRPRTSVPFPFQVSHRICIPRVRHPQFATLHTLSTKVPPKDCQFQLRPKDTRYSTQTRTRLCKTRQSKRIFFLHSKYIHPVDIDSTVWIVVLHRSVLWGSAGIASVGEL